MNAHNGHEAAKAVPAILIDHVSKVYRIGRPSPGGAAPLARLRRRLAAKAEVGARRRGPIDVDDDDDLVMDDETDDEPSAFGGPPREVGALRDVTLEIRRGAGLGLLGPIGAGKSTLIKIVSRLTPPTEGRVVVRGTVAPSLHVAPTFLDPESTGRENAYRLARLFGFPRAVVDRHIEDIFAFGGLEDKIDVHVKRYSGGQHRRLAYSVPLNLEPDILLVDDVLVKGDSAFADQVAQWVATQRRHGLTILMASSDVASVAEYCDRAVWMEEGRIVDIGAPDELEARAQERRTSRPEASEPAPLGHPLPHETHTLLEMVLVHGRGYDELDDVLTIRESQARTMALAAVKAYLPPGTRLSDEDRDAMLAWLLGQLVGEDERGVRAKLAVSELHRAWAKAAAARIELLIPGARVEIPTEAVESGTPLPDRSSTALLKFVRVLSGEARATEVLEQATEVALAKHQSRVKWPQVASAAGLDKEEAEGIMLRMLAEEDAEGKQTGKRSVFNEHLAIVSVVTVASDGTGSSSFRFDEDVGFQVTLETAGSDITLSCFLTLRHEEGDVIRIFDPRGFVATVPGSYRLSVLVPGGVLNEGQHHGRLKVITSLRGRQGVVLPRAPLNFEVFDPRDDDEREADAHEEMPPPGELVDLVWTLKLIERT